MDDPDYIDPKVLRARAKAAGGEAGAVPSRPVVKRVLVHDNHIVTATDEMPAVTVGNGSAVTISGNTTA